MELSQASQSYREKIHESTLALQKTAGFLIYTFIDTTAGPLKHRNIVICVLLSDNSTVTDFFIFNIIISRKSCKEPFHLMIGKYRLFGCISVTDINGNDVR